MNCIYYSKLFQLRHPASDQFHIVLEDNILFVTPNMESYCEEDVEAVMGKLNHRPRKCLDFLTRFEAFFKGTVALET